MFYAIDLFSETNKPINKMKSTPGVVTNLISVKHYMLKY